jgi:3-dehydroquinate synthase
MSSTVRIPIRPPNATATDVWIGRGALESAGERLVSRSGRFLLYSSSAARAATETLRRSLAGRILLDRTVEDAEESKTIDSAAAIAGGALAAGARRDDAVVAVGGGVVTDLVGFAASILLRGVAWNAVPTTTAGMADAAIGGKTGVNHPLGKNLLGAFHPPAAVLVDPAAIATLPDRDYRAGLVEAFKAAWIADAALASRLERSRENVLRREEAGLLEALEGAIRVKASVVSEDVRESGRRRLLNFGHTLGHALEAAGEFRDLKHGEAVAWGIAAALEISRRRAGLSDGDARRVRSLLAALGPFPQPERDPERLRPLLARDKKATARGAAAVLLSAIGEPLIVEDVPPEEWLDAAAIMSLS